MGAVDRQHLINMHRVIHKQLSAQQSKNLMKLGFMLAQIINEAIVEIEKPKDARFKFYEHYCSIYNCEQCI